MFGTPPQARLSTSPSQFSGTPAANKDDVPQFLGGFHNVDKDPSGKDSTGLASSGSDESLARNRVLPSAFDEAISSPDTPDSAYLIMLPPLDKVDGPFYQESFELPGRDIRSDRGTRSLTTTPVTDPGNQGGLGSHDPSLNSEQPVDPGSERPAQTQVCSQASSSCCHDQTSFPLQMGESPATPSPVDATNGNVKPIFHGSRSILKRASRPERAKLRIYYLSTSITYRSKIERQSRLGIRTSIPC